MKRIIICLIIILLITMTLYPSIRLARANYSKALHFYKKGSYSKSVIHLNSVLKNRYINRYVTLKVKSFLMLGKCYNMLGDYRNSEYYLFQVFKNTPINKYYKEALLEIGQTYILSKSYKRSLQVYDYNIRKFIDKEFLSESYYLKGEVLMLMRQFRNAANMYKKVLNNYKGTKRYPDARRRLAEMGYLRIGTSTRAPSRRFDPNRVSIYNVGRRRRLPADRRNGDVDTTRRRTPQVTPPVSREPIISPMGGEITGTPRDTQPTPQRRTTPQPRVTTQRTTTPPRQTQVTPQPQRVARRQPQQTRTTRQTTRRQPTADRVPDIRFPSDRSYYPPNQSFSQRLRYEFLRGISNLSEADLRKLESRLRLLERRERELARIRKELQAFHNLLITKDKLLMMKKKALLELKKELKRKEAKILMLMNLRRQMRSREQRANQEIQNSQARR